MRLRTFALAAILSTVSHQSFGEVIGGCKFDTSTLKFSGDTAQQTVCLLRKVKPQGSGSTIQAIPGWLTTHIGQATKISETRLRDYLVKNNIDAAEIGGPLAKGSKPELRYFVIHDTSSPEYKEADGFPRKMNDANFPSNNLANWNGSYKQKVNVITSRDGRSRTYHPWGTLRLSAATKLENKGDQAKIRVLFVHVENIQPRLKPTNKWAWIAPSPGLSPKQEQRLALAYVAASYQAGVWLVPAYHFNIDEGLPDGHDDPQNMDLQSWAAKVEALESLVGD